MTKQGKTKPLFDHILSSTSSTSSESAEKAKKTSVKAGIKKMDATKGKTKAIVAKTNNSLNPVPSRPSRSSEEESATDLFDLSNNKKVVTKKPAPASAPVVQAEVGRPPRANEDDEVNVVKENVEHLNKEDYPDEEDNVQLKNTLTNSAQKKRPSKKKSSDNSSRYILKIRKLNKASRSDDENAGDGDNEEEDEVTQIEFERTLSGRKKKIPWTSAETVQLLSQYIEIFTQNPAGCMNCWVEIQTKSSILRKSRSNEHIKDRFRVLMKAKSKDVPAVSDLDFAKILLLKQYKDGAIPVPINDLPKFSKIVVEEGLLKGTFGLVDN